MPHTARVGYRERLAVLVLLMASVSTIAFVGAAALTLAVALGFAAVKPWLFVGGGLLVVGFVTKD